MIAPLPAPWTPEVTSPSEPNEPLVVLTTCPDDAAAARIARDLVESGLAACVNRVGGATLDVSLAGSHPR